MFGGQSGGHIQRFKARASGSGFVWSRDGLIVTNAHVVHPPNGSNVSKIEVLFQNGDRVPAHVYSANIGADLALIKVDGYAKMPPPIEVADSNKLQAGQWAIAIGEPFELKQTVTVGVVSGFNRDETIEMCIRDSRWTARRPFATLWPTRRSCSRNRRPSPCRSRISTSSAQTSSP